MSIFDVISLFGGLAMFLYGMRLMGDSLKENSSGTLQAFLTKVTDSPVKAFLLGMFVTALIQSSTATIVITSGLVGAGILSMHQSLGIIIGANVGTTITGQIIRLLDLDASGGTSILQFFQPSTLAPITLIIGIILIMGNFFKNSKSVGNILIGFGVLFSGLLNMTSAVNALSESEIIEHLFIGLGDNPVLGYLSGAGVAFVLQSSSATIGILQAFSQTGLLTFKAVYAIIVGIYLGDCVTTAIVCSIGANADSRRVGAVNILYNLSKTVVILLAVTIAHQIGLLDGIWNSVVNSGDIANANTVFNLACAILLLPMIPFYERTSIRIIKDVPAPERKYKEAEEALKPVFFDTPAIGLQSCYNVLSIMFYAAKSNIEKSLKLLEHFDDAVYKEIMDEEDEIDHLTDTLSKYIVEFFPHLQMEDHRVILDQYYKVTTEFERLGDHAVNIAKRADSLSEANIRFSDSALKELSVLEASVDHLLDEAELTFRKRDVNAAQRMEPLCRVTDELISHLKHSHLIRMGTGECDIYKDVYFSDLLVEFHRIASACSNIGAATVVRVQPELADHQHLYYEHLHEGNDDTFNQTYHQAHETYFSLLKQAEE